MIFVISVIVSFFLIILIFKNFKLFLKFFFSINIASVVIFLLIWIISESDSETIMIGSVILLGLALVGLITEELELKEIKKSLKQGNLNLAIETFFSKNDDQKKSIIKYLSNKKQGEYILNGIFVSYVLDFGYKNSSNQATILFEKQKLEQASRKIWKSCPDFSFHKIKNTLARFRPDLEVSQETPKDTKTGKIIHLIKIENVNQINKNIIDLDDEE